MTWQEFNTIFSITVFDKLLQSLNVEADEHYEKKKKLHEKNNKKNRYVKYPREFIADYYVYQLLPIKELDGKYIIKYVKSNRNRDNFEENHLGYFQEFEKGWVFVSLDSSHIWKRLREEMTMTTETMQSVVLGSNMVFSNFSEIEYNQRYYFKTTSGIDENSFFFKSNCVRINDVYVGSAKSFRYFLITDFAYTSNDFTTNNYVSVDTFFEHLKDLNNDDILVIFDQGRDLKNQTEVMQKYSDKMFKKLLKI